MANLDLVAEARRLARNAVVRRYRKSAKGKLARRKLVQRKLVQRKYYSDPAKRAYILQRVAEHYRKHRSRILARQRLYCQTPEAAKRRRWRQRRYSRKPDVRERKRQWNAKYYRRPEVQLAKKAYRVAYRRDPENLATIRAYGLRFRERRRLQAQHHISDATWRRLAGTGEDPQEVLRRVLHARKRGLPARTRQILRLLAAEVRDGLFSKLGSITNEYEQN
jgi:hypothetical protein